MTIMANKKINMVELRPKTDVSYLLNLLPAKYIGTILIYNLDNFQKS